jgi:hypothetical protein
MSYFEYSFRITEQVASGTLYFIIYLWQYWGLNSGPCACLVGTLLLEPCPHPFLFHYFSNRVCIYARACLNCDTPIYTYCVVRMTGAPHCTQLFIG